MRFSISRVRLLTVTVFISVTFWVTVDRNRRGGNSSRRIMKFNLHCCFRLTCLPTGGPVNSSAFWLRPVNCRWELKGGERESYKDKAESLWSVEQKRCHVDDLVSGEGGKHRALNVQCVYSRSQRKRLCGLHWPFARLMRIYISTECGVMLTHTHALSLSERVWILSMVGFYPQIWQFSPMCLHWSVFHLK